MAKKQMTTREYLRSIARVGATSFKMSPAAALTRLVDSIIQAALPIITTYIAAITTSTLVSAYAGDPLAQDRAIFYVSLTVGIGIITLLWSSVNTYISQKTRYKIEAYIEDHMLEKFSELQFAMYDDKNVIDLHERAKRFSRFFSYIFDTIGSMAASVFGAVGSIVAISFLNVWLGIIILVAVMPGVIIQLRLARWQVQQWDRNITNRRKQGQLGWMLQESRYMVEMRVYGVAKHLIKMHAKLREDDEKTRIDYELSNLWKQFGANLLEQIVQLGALLWITIQIINREQPVGQFVFVQGLVNRALSDVGSLARQLSSIDEDLANIVDYQQFSELPKDSSSGYNLHGPPDKIVVDHVSFAYPKVEKNVLSDISLTIKNGQHVAVVGENGAGKSTLIKLLLGLYPPTQGTIRLDTMPIEAISVESWHRQISLLQQDFIRYHFATIAENITLGDPGRASDEVAIKDAMHHAQFDDIVDKLTHGTETYINRWMAEDNDEATATELSGGQEQRLALARNFYRDSPIVILDEPTSAIDALAEARIFDHLFRSDKTIITISHRLSTVRKADVILMLKDGTIVEQGTYDELIKQNGEFVAMFKSQIK